MLRTAAALRVGWMCLVLVGVGILGFGLWAACCHLPPGKDHVHQIVFIVMSVAGLLVTGRASWGADLTTARQPASRGGF